MATNRLYLYDPETGEKFLIAKAMSDGWYVKDSIGFADALDAWLKSKDIAASYGGTGSTSLQIITEGDLPTNT